MGLVSVLFMLVSTVMNTVYTMLFMRRFRTGILCEYVCLAIRAPWLTIASSPFIILVDVYGMLCLTSQHDGSSW